MSLKQASVEQLVAIVQASADTAAFNELFSRYQQKLRAFLAFQSADSRFDVDDLMQETYVKAFLNIQQFEQKAQFSTWLLRIAFYEMLQSKRSQGIFRRLKDRWFSGNAEPMIHTDSTDQHLDAEQLIAGLSDLQQQVFIYTEFYGYSQTEIADKLHIPLGSIKTYLKQARDALEKEQKPC